MAAGIIGSIEPFSDSRENFDAYVERLEMYFLVNDIESEDKRKAALLSLVGAQTYNLLRSLTAPNKPKDRKFDELIALLKSHLSPVPLEIAEGYRFFQRSQKDNETIADFLVSLKQRTEHCNFGNFLNQAIRDRFACGLSSQAIQSCYVRKTSHLKKPKPLPVQWSRQQKMQLKSKSTLKYQTATRVNHRKFLK